MIEHIRKLFAYDKWATDVSLDTLSEPANDRARLMLAHLLWAEKIWMIRLLGEDSSKLSNFDQLSLAECVEMSDEVHRSYTQYLAGLDESALDTMITYRNTQGVEYQTPIRDILVHVALHGVYHRGQVALLVRDAGGRAAGTDYILYTRL